MSGIRSVGKMRLMKSLNTSIGKKKPFPPIPFRILRGDSVHVISGPCAGQKGVVKDVIRKTHRVVVDGVNVRSRKQRGNPSLGLKARIVERPCSLHYSNVNVNCPVTNLPTRVGVKYLKDGTKVRVSKKSGAVIPRPEVLKVRRKVVRGTVGGKETDTESVWMDTR